LDGIPARFIFDSADVIAHPLAHVINLSLIQGIVPDELKAELFPYSRNQTKPKLKITVLSLF